MSETTQKAFLLLSFFALKKPCSSSLNPKPSSSSSFIWEPHSEMLPALEFGLPASAQEFRKGQIQTALYLVVPQAPTNERGRKERGREKGRRDEEKRRGVEKLKRRHMS